MSTLVIKSFPDELHAQLKAKAAENRRSVTQETILLIENALHRGGASRVAEPDAPSYWATRKILPELEGTFTEGTDSTEAISDERDHR
jgi:plasmid stability protein